MIVERNGCKFGTCDLRNHIFRVLFLSDSLSSVLGHSRRKISDVKIVKPLLPQFSCDFNQFYGKYGDNE